MLMGKAAEIWEDLEPLLADAGYELVDMDWHHSPQRPQDSILRLFIDRLDRSRKVTIKDCETTSRMLDLTLDESNLIDHGYTLEVSSPGMERRVRKPEDFKRFNGREVQVEFSQKYEGRRKVKGTIEANDETSLTLKIETGDTFEVPLHIMKRARLVVDFDRILGKGKR